MHVPELLEAASPLVPEDIATENDITVRDVWPHLVHGRPSLTADAP
jgi:hypothetical protein